MTKRLHPQAAHLERGNGILEKEIPASTDESGQNIEQLLPHLERGNGIAEKEIPTSCIESGQNIEQLLQAAAYVPALPIIEDKTILSWFEEGKYEADNTISHKLQLLQEPSGVSLRRSCHKHYPFNMRAINIVNDGMYYC